MGKKDNLQYCDRSLFISPIYYALCTNEKSYHNECKRVGILKKYRNDFISNNKSDATVHYFETKGKTICFVCIDKEKVKKEKTSDVEIYGLLIHEAVHIWQEIKLNIGENNPSQEFEAYSIQCIAQQLIQAYNA